ncbi:MAG: 4-alpha-glucanotransferase [Bosea sp. (in: a-proteobacteria)]|uniref:4-alpha-glucanotransferase n=1 Tax=Bosea sp. (in: a-proteobacteria) TaxID=1871050 RepID=UPI002735CE74|nr:4-alpha-glucanotransferase [Bosea sp. (in: a-proteobacteria)]MDP3602174.1 4-alpha-glucanotransferase [Bosea sp. (in: a-proteobacteria)]
MSDDILRQLAVKAGIAPRWTEQTGTEREVSAQSLRVILQALGLPAGTDADLRQSLATVEAGANLSAQSRFTTARTGQPVVLPIAAQAGSPVELTLDGGTRRTLRSEEGYDGSLTLPAFDRPGYHTVHLDDGDFTIATAPERCITFADLNGGAPGFGLTAQIYSLRSPDDGGIGHFAGVTALGRAAAARGADALAISPVHALYGASPEHFSPYSPSTRLFYNPLHADPAAVLPETLLREIIAREGLGEEMDRLSALRQIDWPAATLLRQRLLRALFEALRAADGSGGPAREALDRALAEASPLLRSHAVFEVLHAAELRRDRHAWRWRDWDAAFRDPDGPAVAAFAAEHATEVDYQIFLQWLTASSYGAAQRACREAGMKVGLIADLAIGMDASGSHAWSRQHEVLGGLSVGAPPDYYAAEGQSWGLTTFSPRGLAASGFAPFIETLRASLRHVGGIRIDHVMGLSRLWLVPEGASAMEGAYVTFPSETLFRLVALESWRHSAIVIGEDLGTLPDGFRDDLRRQGVAGLRVLRFEKSDHGYIAPEHWDAGAVALTTTHDLIPTAGWWAGADLEPTGDGVDHEGIRAWDRGVLWSAFQQAGLVEGERPAPEETEPVVDAAIRFITRTLCTLKLLPIEDALGIRTQPNVPGTTTEKPNWRHRLDGEAATLLDDDRVRRRLADLGPPRSEG